ncbi:phage holin [Companilactobacillus nodensis]|uniref:Holin n=1 Tax=Companilactobacillus nodensis DSM 19682 = JCM 14932 = NBRC 107160 TaxID=1423775 RepID=A0A0R1K9U1_9LACO|nr:phage holin [Companilactobacillus nodensis]KRK80236.1 hypothetical protein FD03_GL002626 [Companilactobacillus nodensis DSM 19682 = JCM 14932 = NBRC 107160]
MKTEKIKSKLSIDWHSPIWWASLVSILLVLIQQVLSIFGISMPEGLAQQITDVVNSLLSIGGLLGIIYDTSKKPDSEVSNEK